MANLSKSTRLADTTREECLCVRECARGCPHAGQWHAHESEPCPVHTEVLVAG